MITLLLFACGDDSVTLDPSSQDSVLDVTIDEADLGPLGPDQLVLEGPAVEIEPGEDKMICVYGTYTGPDVGLHDVHTHQGRYGHHLQLMGTTTPTLDAPDGTIVDCTGDTPEFQMASLEPIGLTNGGEVDGEPIGVSMPLPDGYAVELESGQRYILQAHYVNASSERLRIGDKAVLTVVPTEEVQTWVAPLVLNRDDFRIPAGGELTTSFDCTTEADWSAMYLLGHMHEWGTSFRLDRVEGDTVIPTYEVPEWDPVFRDAPMVMDGTTSPLALPAGTTLRTTCSWSNDTAEDLVFPHEMCVAVMFVYPQKATVICDGNGQ
jgi:hypothetical protein